MFKIYILISLCLIGLKTNSSEINDYKWEAYTGIGYVDLPTSATVNDKSGMIHGANASSSNSTTLLVGINYNLNSKLSVEYAAGYPPTTTVSGKGTLKSSGAIGEITYAPSVITAKYTVLDNMYLQPYVGVGASWTHVLNTKDHTIKNLEVKDSFGPVLQIGLKKPLNEKLNFLVDVKKIWLKTKANGEFQGEPVEANIKFSPLVTMIGLGYKF